MKHKILALLAVAASCAWLVAVPGAALAVEEEESGYRLSLADSLRKALENNLDLVAARTDPRISEENVVAEEAGFDFGVSFDPQHIEQEQEISNLFSLTEFMRDTGTISLTKDLMFGADYGVDLNLTRDEAAGPFVTTDKTYNAELGLRLNVPIMGTNPATGASAGRTATTARLVLAQGNLEISNETLRTEAHRIMEEVENAYWNVLANQRALDSRKLALKRAEDLLELNKKKVEVGTLAPIEITEAEAGVASNEEQVIIAETDLANAEDELRRLLAIPDDDPLWGMKIVPTDRPDFSKRRIDLDEAIVAATANRPELRVARQQLSNDELSERVARKRLRPFVGASATLSPEGNNFETIIPDAGDPFQVTEGTFDEAMSEIPDFDNYTWSVGLNVNYTIGNRAAKSNYAIASLNRQKSEIDVRNQEQLIRVEVRRSVRAVDSGIKRVEAATKNVELQEKKLEAEQKKFDNGMSTSFEVLTFQNDLADAELAQIQAALDYVRALTALERSKGTLLEARGLALAEE